MEASDNKSGVKIKFRHNKKRNVLFLYEALIRTLTRAILASDDNLKKTVLGILKEHFAKGSFLRKEVGLYRVLHNTTSVPRPVAERILQEVLRVYSSFGQNELKKEQDALISDINHRIPKKNFYLTFVPSYRNLATIYSLFHAKPSIKQRALLEEKIIESLTSSELIAEKTNLQPVDSLAFKIFVASFNKSCEELLREQKELLQKYIVSSGNMVEFRTYLNEEIGRIRTALPKLVALKEVQEDEGMKEKVLQLEGVLAEFAKRREITAPMLETLLYVQQLISEGSP
jgi:hypothetical protein